MGVDRLPPGALALGGKPVRNREDGDVGGVGFGGKQVVVDAAPRQRLLVDQEAEPQVVDGQVHQVVGETAAGTQAEAELADEAGTGAIVADEQDPASLAHGACLRLAEVVEEGREAQRITPGELVGERLRQQRANVRGRRAHEGLEVGLHLDQPRQHLHGVPVNVEMVVRVLLDPAKRLELGQQGRRRRELVQELQPPHRLGAREQQAQLSELALTRRLRRPSGLRAGESGSPRIDLEHEAGGDPRRPQDPEWVVGEAARGDGAQHPRLEVGQPAMRVHEWGGRVGKRDRDRIDREVAQGEVSLDSIASQPGDVNVPGAVGRQGAPAGELLGQHEHGPARHAADLAGRLPLVARDRQVEVPDLPAEGRVADRTADDPGSVPPAESSLARAYGRSGGQQLCDGGTHGPAERTCTRGTRGAIPQVTS